MLGRLVMVRVSNKVEKVPLSDIKVGLKKQTGGGRGKGEAR